MKYNFWTILMLVIAGACLGFFGLVYWNLDATIKQAEAGEMKISKRLSDIEKFLAPEDKTNLK